MTTEIILVFSILIVTIIFFAFEIFSVDKIAFFIITTLAITGLVSPEEAISGFSNSATITVLSLMIIALAMEDNGVITSMASLLKKMHALPFFLLLPCFMLITGSISAFINTTAVVIVFIKIIAELAKRFNIPQSKLLMPISFAGILGGSCTLMGTSTNLIVNSVANDLGAEHFTFFEFSLFGMVFLLIGIVVITIGSRWLPKDNKETLEESYELKDFVTTVKIHADSELIDKKIEDTFFYTNPEISILKLTRNGRTTNAPGRYITFREKDKLLLMCDVDSLTKLQETEGITIIEEQEHQEKENDTSEKSDQKEKHPSEENLGLIELLILPGSFLIGKTLKQLRISPFNNALPIAIKKRRNIRNTQERLIRKNIYQIRLKPGDRLLVEINKEEIHHLYELENVVILREHEIKLTPNPRKKIISSIILLLIIASAASGLLNILVSSIMGVSLLLLFRCLNLSDVYHRINWEVFFLLAGMIPLGVAMSNTGADHLISSFLLDFLQGHSHLFSIGSIFLITMLLSSVISNNATAVIMTPIAIAVAIGLELSMKPFILAVLFGANFSFFTPIGYQTNTLIYGMGFYKFKHFVILGGILSIILWATGTWMLSTLL